jgi:beta-glucosidase
MDNLEWNLGRTKRFGLVYTDYETQRRVIKDSGLWYAGVAVPGRPVEGGPGINSNSDDAI